jgi:signal transduction histidine kinase
MTNPVRILVVDDTPQNVKLLADLLAATGYAVSTASSGREALTKVDTDRPDLILLDVVMPEMSGYEVCRKLRDNPATALLPVVLVTALYSGEERVKGLDAGPDDFLTKPIHRAELLARVRSLLRIKRYQDQLADLNLRLEESNGRLKALDQLKSDFLSDVAHELRTPLTSIKGYLDCLLDGTAGEIAPAQKGFLETVRSNTERITRLIGDLLDLARIEAGRVDFHPARLSLPDIVEEVINLLRIPAAEKGIDLAGAVPEADLVVDADRDKLHQILLNLIHNAVKFTPAGGSVRVRAERGSERTVVIVVDDTGEGIAPEDLGQVFEKFYQGGDPGPKSKGSGLGLTITKKLVELHGGAIRVTSEPGRGSAFVVTLPAGAPETA